MTTKIPDSTSDDAPQDVQRSDASPAVRRRRPGRRALAVTAALLVVVLAVASVSVARWNAGVNSDLAASVASVTSAGDDLTAAHSAATTTLDTDAADADPALVTQLRAALAEPAPTPASDGSRQDRTAANHAQTAATTAVVESITMLTGRVHDSAEAKRLADAKAAYATATATLDTALADASTLLSASEGKVADDTTRQALATAITTAQQARATNPAPTVGAYQAATTAATGQMTALRSASDAVTASQATWQAQQDAAAKAAADAAAKAAAEKAAKDAASTKSSGSASAKSTKPSSSSGRSSAPSNGGSSTSTSSKCAQPTGPGFIPGHYYMKKSDGLWYDVTAAVENGYLELQC